MEIVNQTIEANRSIETGGELLTGFEDDQSVVLSVVLPFLTVFVFFVALIKKFQVKLNTVE